MSRLNIDDILEARDPLPSFIDWLAQASASELNDANAMALATVDGEGLPDVRMVLLKGVDANGFVFYTNALSNKGKQLAATGKAALLFHWKSLRRQIRIRGGVETATEAEADAYFGTRSRESRLGAWASQQSRPLESRRALEASVAAFAAKYPDENVPRPPYWIGYRLKPLVIEFWQDGASRLHDRVMFTRSDLAAPWHAERLFP